MAVIRNADHDKMKSQTVLKEQFALQSKCRLADCDQDLTLYEGPGSDSYCRNHQLLLTEYGGFGKADRPHTFYRNWICVKCGYDVRLDPEILSIEDPFRQLQVMRSVMEGDHIIRKSDGGADTADNINSLCCRCHRIKTVKEQDFRKGLFTGS